MMDASPILRATIDGSTLLSRHPEVEAFDMVGSACYMPAPADVDFLVLMRPTVEGWSVLTMAAAFPEFRICAGEYDDQDNQWCAIRSGLINLIVTHDKGWYDRALLANSVCRLLEIANKRDRIAVYRLIRDGKSIHEARATARASKV